MCENYRPLLFLHTHTHHIPSYPPLYSIPELSLTRTGRPNTDLRKSDGDRLFWAAAAAAYEQCECECEWLSFKNTISVTAFLQSCHTHLRVLLPLTLPAWDPLLMATWWSTIVFWWSGWWWRCMVGASLLSVSLTETDIVGGSSGGKTDTGWHW